MFRAFAVAAVFFVAGLSPAAALEWFTETADGSITTTAFEGASSVAITCTAGALTFAVRVRESEIAPPIASANAVYVRTTSDPAADGTTPAFTSRATVDKSGSSWSYSLDIKDSAARIAAFASAKTELEFSLMTEPGGERFNTFRLPVAGAGDALGEVLAACSGPAPEPEASSEPPPPVAEGPVSRDWTMDGWVADVSGGYGTAYVSSSGANPGAVRVHFGCSDGTNSFRISISNDVVGPAIVDDQASFLIQADFGRGVISFDAYAIPTSDAQLMGVEPGDATTAFYNALSPTGSILRFGIVDKKSGITLHAITTGIAGLSDALSKVQLACSPPTPPVEAERAKGVWNYYVDDANRETAEIELDDGSLVSFLCSEDRKIVFYFAVPEVHGDIAGRDQVDVVFGVDPNSNGVGSRNWVSDVPLKVTDTVATIGFRGPAADTWARLAQGANRGIQVGFSPDADASEFSLYNSNIYPAKGSTAALKQFRAACK